MAYKRNVEIFEEAYEKKNAKSVVSYVARDGRRRYIAGNKNPDGGGTPMPSGGMTEVTWQELKDKRDNGELNPGSLYRITDYNCTTTQENTQSAGHQFDIVLLALSENKLAEEGWAMMHENDTYFANSNLSAWKVWYCLDNDKSRFAWADDPNGRGVIYRLVDEWGNDCPYDFKNILYLRKLDGGSIDANGTDTYIPTFCLYDNGNDEYKDASIFAIYYSSDENIIGACYDNIIKMVNTSDIEECYAFKLPNNIILELVETGDTSWQTHSNIIFAESCSFGATVNCNVMHAYERTYTHIPSGIIFGNKQVVWEDIS